MTSAVVTTGMTGNTYKALFRKQILRVKPPAVGMAVAYVSASGFTLVKKILDEGGVGEVRLVTDTKDGVTHPRALQGAVDSGWTVRIVDNLAGTFHPKLYVGAARFDDAGVADLSLAITGSPNLSYSGFLNNGECVFWSATPHSQKSAGKAWLDCWNAGVPATVEKLAAYEKYFSLRNRYRKPEDMVALGIADSLPEKTDGAPNKGCYAAEEGAQSDFRSRSFGSVGRFAIIYRRVQPSGRVSKGSRTGASSHLRAPVRVRHHRHTLRRCRSSKIQIQVL